MEEEINVNFQYGDKDLKSLFLQFIEEYCIEEFKPKTANTHLQNLHFD